MPYHKLLTIQNYFFDQIYKKDRHADNEQIETR